MITIDRRELTEHPDIPDLLHMPHREDTLEAADYCFLDRDCYAVGIERCAIGNFLQKLRSGELENQLIRCAEYYQTTIVLVEGVYDEVAGQLAIYKQTERGYIRQRIEPHTKYTEIMASMVRLSELGFEIVQTANFSSTMTTIRTVYNQRTKAEEDHRMFKAIRTVRIPCKLSNDPAVPRLMALVPRMSEKTAVSLILQYGDIWNILTANEKEVLEVHGMGKTLLSRLKDNVGMKEEMDVLCGRVDAPVP